MVLNVQRGTSCLERGNMSSTYHVKSTPQWRTWDRDFAEAEEVNLMSKLLNVDTDNTPYNCSTSTVGWKGRGRIKVCIQECKLPTTEQIMQYSYSTLSTSSSQAPSTEKFCKIIGKGRGRGRLKQAGPLPVGRGLQCDDDDNLKQERSQGNNKSKNDNECTEDRKLTIDHQLGTLHNIIESIEEPDRWIMIDGVPDKHEGRKDLVNTIEEFGKIQSLSYHNESKALIRMSTELQCEWVISCLHGTQLSASSNKIFVSRIKDVVNARNTK